jgi:hypothetical protein
MVQLGEGKQMAPLSRDQARRSKLNVVPTGRQIYHQRDGRTNQIGPLTDGGEKLMCGYWSLDRLPGGL